MKTIYVRFLLLFLFAFSLIFLGFEIDRTSFSVLILSYGIAFFSYYFLVKNVSNTKETKRLLIVAVLMRLLLCFSFPHLSDDIYRFFWDGKLLANGYNPFAYLPSYFIENQIFTSDFDLEIYKKLNSPQYFSVYPPVCQLIFSTAYTFFPKNIFAVGFSLKLFLFLCELGTILLLQKMEKDNGKISKNAALWYALNPLCIIEICGNIHFEGAMIFFFLLAIYFFQKEKFSWATLFYTLSICSKLLTLVFLPLMFVFLCRKKMYLQAFFFCSVVILLTLVFFYPFLDATFIANFSSSINLYFQKFEFNGSLYYILKMIGIRYYGFNPTGYVSTILSGSVLINIAVQSFRKVSLYEQFFYLLFGYLLCQAIVHPWYLTTLLLLSILSEKKVGIWWTCLVFLSYSHYQDGFYQENFYCIMLEYSVLLLLFLLERHKKLLFT